MPKRKNPLITEFVVEVYEDSIAWNDFDAGIGQNMRGRWGQKPPGLRLDVVGSLATMPGI